MSETLVRPAAKAAFHAEELVNRQREYFKTGVTLPLDFRIAQLKKLRNLIERHEGEILEALNKDLGKSAFEAYGTEVGFTLTEIDHTLKHIRQWAKPKRVGTPMFHAVGSSHIYNDPYGVVLIVGPWNYPFQLAMAPLIGAISAGNCSVVKPSEIAEHTGRLVERMLNTHFDEKFVRAVFGGIEESKALLDERFDYIFFTGGTGIGKVYYQAAAKHLTPVTLELGGKSPCIIDKKVHVEYAAKRIIWGKFTNAGQTCVAPDYLLIHEGIKSEVLAKMKEIIREFYGDDPQKSPDYGRIINERHFKRLAGFLKKGQIVAGGQTDEEDLYIAPTIIDGISLDDPVMADEIFGPVLPVLTYRDLSEAIDIINNRFGKPLALYVFTENSDVSEKVLEQCSFGGGCVNDTLMHLGNPNLPFGGVGDSGIGAYHGEYSFTTFSHQKAVLKKSTLLDLKVRYAPYGNNLPILKKLMKYLG